jgi:hypothetical protein
LERKITLFCPLSPNHPFFGAVSDLRTVTSEFIDLGVKIDHISTYGVILVTRR